MHHTAQRQPIEILSQPDEAQIFVNELAALSHKYGIVISGQPVLFIMEKDDFGLAYEIDDDSNLKLTSI